MKKQLEFLVDEEEQMFIELTKENIELVYKFAELLQHEEVEGLDIDHIKDDIKEAHQDNV